jgi:CARDB
MQRIALIAALGLLGLAPAASAAPKSFGIHLTKCHRAVSVSTRSFHLRAAMHPTKATKTMGIRFDLQARLGRRGPWRSYRAVFGGPAVGFGTWYRSGADVERYRYLRLVNGLDGAPGRGGRHVSVSYRVRTGFRWYDADGNVLRTKHRHSRPCFQPELRPDLHIAGVHPVTTKRGFGYRVIVRNRGRTMAGPFHIGLSIPDIEVGKPLPGLAAGATLHPALITGFPCPSGQTLTVTVDDGKAVDEADETDDERALTCP